MQLLHLICVNIGTARTYYILFIDYWVRMYIIFIYSKVISGNGVIIVKILNEGGPQQ